jgi:Pleckstrin homology domain
MAFSSKPILLPAVTMLTTSRQFRYVKHHFWFSDEPLKSEHLASYVRDEKANVAHPNAAWAQETGKGVLFFAKRAEDKATPSGLILMV